VQLLPASYVIGPCDYAVLFQFLPTGPETTDVVLNWLVDPAAQVEDEAAAERLTWFWQTTMTQDQAVVESCQRGVRSSFYEPGPYGEREYASAVFTRWYLDRLGGRAA
jgi:Rieske 2Fe-2S family protein